MQGGKKVSKTLSSLKLQRGAIISHPQNKEQDVYSKKGTDQKKKE